MVVETAGSSPEKPLGPGSTSEFKQTLSKKMGFYRKLENAEMKIFQTPCKVSTTKIPKPS